MKALCVWVVFVGGMLVGEHTPFSFLYCVGMLIAIIGAASLGIRK